MLHSSQAILNERLASLYDRFDDLSNEHLSRLFAPIGIEISSRTPAEIAISIVAQLITERAKAAGRFALNQTFKDRQFFND